MFHAVCGFCGKLLESSRDRVITVEEFVIHADSNLRSCYDYVEKLDNVKKYVA